MNKTFQSAEKTISVLGCGWLGLPLAISLKSKNYQVKGSTSNPDKLILLQNENIIPYRILLDPDINSDFKPDFFDSEILIVNFPPKRRDDIISWHSKQIDSLLTQIRESKVEKVIFISSTSVYADNNSLVSEQDNAVPPKNSGKALRIVENKLMNETNFTSSILRFGGLIGYDRKPGRFLSAGKKLKNGHSPVNLIHRDDCISIIEHIIENDIWGEILNACCPQHPGRKEFYQAAAKAEGFDVPDFSDSMDSYKIVDSSKIIEKYRYNFKYKSPIDTIGTDTPLDGKPEI